MECPSCKTNHQQSISLQPTTLEDGLLAQGCPSCDGALVSLLHYRHWAENADIEPVDQCTIGSADDSAMALKCPKCARIMSKYTISGHKRNRVDLCTHCDEAWLDGGEWLLLKELSLSNKLPNIFTQSWQSNVRKQQSENRETDTLKKQIGQQDTQRCQRFRQWLTTHKNRTEILFYLNNKQ